MSNKKIITKKMRKFLGKFIRKASVALTILATMLSSFGPIVMDWVPIAKAASTITEAAAPAELLGSPNVTARANALVATDAFSLIQISGSATLNSVAVTITDPGTTGLVSADIASVALRKESGATAGFQAAEDGVVAGAVATTPAIGSPITLTPTAPEAIGATPVRYYIAATIAASPTNNHNFAVNFAANYGITSDPGTVGSALTATKKVTIDIIAPTAPTPGDYQIVQSPPGTPDQIAVKQGVSVGTAGDTAKIYAADGTTFLGSATLGGSPNVQFAPINIGDNANATVKVEFVDPAGNASGQAAVGGNDIVAPAIQSAAAFTDRIILNFSENVDGMMAMNCANYIVNGSVLTCGGMGLPFVDFQGTKATIRGLSLSGTVNFSIPSNNTIKDFAQNTLTAYSNAAMSVSVLVLPSISSITPSSGAVGDTITIAGANFGTTATPGDANHKVFFSGGFSQSTGPLPPVEANYTGGSWSATSIAVKVPAGAQGGPVNIMNGGVMSDMGPNTFFDIKGDYTARVYYGANNTSPMPDADKANIRIAIMSMRGPVVYSTNGSSGNTMTYTNGTPGTFTITGVPSMGFTYAYDISGTHLNSSGMQVNTSATQNLIMLATSRKISGTVTMGATCVAGGQNKDVVVMAMPDVVDTGSSGFKEVNPSFFRTGPVNGQTACQTTYSMAIPINGTYRVEAHIPPDAGATTVGSSAYTDPSSLQVAITDSALTASGKNFTFSAATHKIVGHVQKPGGAVNTTEGGMLWVFAYQPVENGKGTGTQVDSNGDFTLNVSPGAWKVGVGGPNMPFPVEVPIVVDDTFLISAYTAGTKIIVIAPPSDFIEGYVKDSAGNGLSNVSLYSWLEGGPGGGNAKTDSQGYYKMYVTPGSNYHIGANSQSFGFLGEQSNISVTSSIHPTVNFNVSSSDNYTISGTVTKGGQPLQQAFVFITDGQQGPMMGSGGTDATGAYTVRVSGGANRWLHVGLPAKGEIYLENLGTISASNTSKNIAVTSSTVTVRFSPASSFSDAFVGVHGNLGDGFSDTDVSTNASSYKEYQIDVRRPASGATDYYVEGGIQGYGSIPSVPVTVNSDGTFTETSGTANDGIVEVTVSGLYTVSGTVSGTNVLDAWVWASGPNGGNGASVAADGSYSLKLRNGTYDIGVGKQDFIGNKISVTVNGADVASQNLALTGADQTITGTVYLPDGVTTATNAKIWASNGNGGFASASTDASGNYTLKVGSGSWTIKAAYDGYNSSSTVVAAPATGKNITLTAISGFVPNTKNQPITPANGGTVQGTGIKVDFPKNALGTGTGSGTVEVKDTTNYTTTDATQVIGTAKEITALNDSNQTVTKITGNINIELTVTKAQLQSAGLTLDQAKKIKISSPSTSGAWTEIKTTATLSVPTAATIADLNSDPAITFTGTTSHLSTYALTQASVGAPPMPTGLTATAGNGSASLSWTASAGATKYDVYKQIGSDYPYLAQTTSTTYTATGLTNGTVYYFKVSALDDTNKESAATAAVSVTPVAPSGGGGGGGVPVTTPPTNTSIVIAGGAANTLVREVTLTLAATDATQMAISNTSDFSGASWETYATSKSWTLTAGDGTKTVYAKFRDAGGDVSTAVSDTIILGTSTGSETPSSSTSIYPDGTLIKSDSAPEVYVIKDGKRVWIPNAQAFISGGYKWENIKVVTGEVIKQVGSATLIRVAGDPRVYVVVNNARRHIKTAEEFNSQGYKWADIVTVSAAELEAYPESGAVAVGGKTIIVTAASLRIRSANSTSGKALGWVKKNDKYTILDESNGWYKITSKAGITGWVSGQYAATTSAAVSTTPASTASGNIVINNTWLRVRSVSSTKGTILGYVNQGEVYALLGEENGWYKIKTKKDGEGWVSGEYAAKQ